MKNKRVVVTGGSGFIGSHLVERLLKEGANVAVTVRYGDVVKNERLKHCYDKLHIIEADLRNRGALGGIKEFNPEMVFHLAAYNHVGQSFHQVEECFDVNAKGTANLIDVCGDNLEKFIYTSTSEVYGLQDGVPFVETMTPRPISPYSITKYSGEQYCQLKQRVKGSCPIMILRPFNTFGPYQSAKAVIPELIEKCLRGETIETTQGQQTREFNYVDNTVDGFIAAANCKENFDGPINVGAGEEVKIRDLVQMIADATQTTSEIKIGALPDRPTEIWRMYCDATRAKEVLGWTPKVALKEGIQRTVDWYRSFHGVEEFRQAA